MPTPSPLAPTLPSVLLVAALLTTPHVEAGAAQPDPTPEWIEAEAPILTGHVRLTSPSQFSKAGEAYFSPDGAWIIFQAVEVGLPANTPYAMYVASLVRDASGAITGLNEPIQITPEGSANTCGWFHPTDPTKVMLGSTITPPSSEEAPGFQVGRNRYLWAFPEEMDVATRTIPARWIETHGGWPGTDAPPDWEIPVPIFERAGYDAECTWSPDARHILYAHVDPVTPDENGVMPPADADIWVYDTKTQQHTVLVQAPGYDGGPFFSHNGKWICYRSDRSMNDHLQLYIAELDFDNDGAITGIKREIVLTDNDVVNWCPYWHPSDQFILYATSELGHDNYEVFAIDADPRVPLAERRRMPITRAMGADVLPAFDATGRWMMWTSRRQLPGEKGDSSTQLWVARFNAAAMEQQMFMDPSGQNASN